MKLVVEQINGADDDGYISEYYIVKYSYDSENWRKFSANEWENKEDAILEIEEYKKTLLLGNVVYTDEV